MDGLITDLVRFGGAVILAAAVLQAVVLLVGSWQRMAFARKQRGLALEVFNQRVAAAMAKTRAEQERAAHSWEGFRKFRVHRKVAEADGVASLYLVPVDGKPLPPYRPGQYLTLRLRLPGQPRPLIRCYSLSDSPDQNDHYRLTVKRLLPPPDKRDTPPGLVSSYLYEYCKEGDQLDVKAPAGRFHLDPEESEPVVFVAGGIGITPILSMLNAVVRTGGDREVWLFYGVKNRASHVMKAHLEHIAAAHPNVRLRVAYSDPDPGSEEGRDYHIRGHVTIDVLRRALPSSNYTFYICGPSAMMRDLPPALREWGVPPEDIHSEAFGAASVKATAISVEEADESGGGFEVEFKRSGVTASWTPAIPTLLDLAEQKGLSIEYGCRAGHCGTCATSLVAGDVEYLDEPAAMADAGTCLVCIAKPKTDVVLEA